MKMKRISTILTLVLIYVLTFTGCESDNKVIEGSKIAGLMSIDGQVLTDEELSNTKLNGYYQDIVELSSIEGESSGYYKAMSDGIWGLIDSNSNTIIDCQYDKLEYVDEAYIFVSIGNETSLINLETKEVTAVVADAVYKMEGITFTFKDGKFGMLNLNKDVLLANEYNTIFPENEFISVFNKDNKFGFINIENEFVTQAVYSSVTVYDDYILIENEVGKVQYLDYNGKPITDKAFDKATDIVEGNALVELDDIFYTYNLESDFLTRLDIIDFHEVYPYHQITAHNDLYLQGLIGYDGKFIIEPIYERFMPFLDQDISFGTKDFLNNYEFINRDGEFLFEYKCNSIGIFDDNGNIKIQNPKSGMINSKGEVVFEPIYDWIRFHRNSKLYTVMKDGKYGLFDKYGQTILNIDYDDIQNRMGIIFIAIMDDENILYDSEIGELVNNSNNTYDFNKYRNGLFPFTENERWGVMSISGEVYLEAIYNEIKFIADKGQVVVGDENGYKIYNHSK